MVKEIYSDQMDTDMKVNSNMENFKGLGNLSIQMDHKFMKESFIMVEPKAQEFLNGLMEEEFMKEKPKMVLLLGKVQLFGKME